MATKSQLVELAQEKLSDVIDILEIACDGDGNAKAYMIDQLRVLASNDHGFFNSSLNMNQLVERYEDDRTDVGGDDYFESYHD